MTPKGGTSILEGLAPGSKLSKEEFDEQAAELRVDLLNAQFDLGQRKDTRLIVLLMGDDRIGCDEIIDRLHQWLDARHVDLEVFPRVLTEEERQRPLFWRYWLALPSNGSTGVFLGGWASSTIAARVLGGLGKKEYERRIEHVLELERTLAEGGAGILKLWVHLPPKEHEKRLKKAAEKPTKEYRVEDVDFEIFDAMEDALPQVEDYLLRTDTGHAPWVPVDGSNARHRDISVGRALLDAYRRVLATPVRTAPEPRPSTGSDQFAHGALDKVDLSSSIEEQEYKERLDELQARLSRLVRKARKKGVSSVLAFEGWDAAGKGGTIRRITGAISARDFKVVPIAAPTEEERAHHYLWRFWRHLPRAGRMLIYDRTWYGRVLVERVEGFAHEDEWRRAYDEIRDFEEQLVEHGMLVSKFWLHIDPEEQLRRFQDREKTGYKKYKITDEDYRNREKWDAYVTAINEMVARTSTKEAPWTVVPNNDKRFGRLMVLETVCEGLERVL